MAEKLSSKKLDPQLKKWLPVGIVLLLAILAHQLDMNSLQFYDIKKSVFTRVDLGDYAEMQAALMEKQETKLMQNEKFWDNLKDNTKTLISNLMTAAGKIDDYTISYEWAD